MAWLAVNPDGKEIIFKEKPRRSGYFNSWQAPYKEKEWERHYDHFILPTGSIKRLIGRRLTWKDEPVKYTGGEVAGGNNYNTTYTSKTERQ